MQQLTFYKADDLTAFELPYAEGGVKAGFPSPAQDTMDTSLDLNRELITHKESSFYVRVNGTSMIDANLHDKDLLIVDRALDPLNGDICVCCLNGEFTVKHVVRQGERLRLVPANPDFCEIELKEGDDFEVWGVVTYIIHRPQRLRGV